MKIIDGHDVIEHAEVNGEDRAFIRKLTDYIEDAPVVEPKTGDLIKREDALLECEALTPIDCKMMKKRIKEIPSAEPTIEIDAHQLAKLLREGWTIHSEPKWIPCSERLPEDSGDYLVRFSDEYIEDHSSLDLAEIEIERFDADCESFGYWVDRFDPVSLGFVDSDWVELPIIAWMPLPEPWEGADDERSR